MIAAVGLVESSPVKIVAAMLFSPLMVRVSEIYVAFYV
jgi:Fe2+ transport system protein FeoA